MIHKHELSIKITFKTDSDMSDFETARNEMLRKIRQEFYYSLCEDGIIEEDYKIELIPKFIPVDEELPNTEE